MIRPRCAFAVGARAHSVRVAARAAQRRDDSDAATASVPYVPVLANTQGFVHGGVAASLSVWTAMMVAVASDRDRAASARPVSISVSYLAAAREEALHATARVAARGRDIVHVEIEIVSDRGRPVAAALAVLRTLVDASVAAAFPSMPASRTAEGAAEGAAKFARPLVSPFAQSMGIGVRSLNAASCVMAMPRDVNAGLGSAHRSRRPRRVGGHLRGACLPAFPR